MIFGKQLKSELAKYNIPMTNNVIEINNKDQEETIITQIEYIIQYLNNRDDEIDDNIEKELEEKYKDEIDNLKTSHDINLLDKCFTKYKSKMKK
jgi:hypothetical protein